MASLLCLMHDTTTATSLIVVPYLTWHGWNGMASGAARPSVRQCLRALVRLILSLNSLPSSASPIRSLALSTVVC